MLLGIAGIWSVMGGIPNNPDSLFSLLFICMFSVFPQIVSIVISVYSKHFLPHVLSATVSLLHGYCFAAYSIMMFLAHVGTPLVLPGLWVLLLPILLPLWIAAIVIEIRHRKKSQQTSTEP
jgi:hypothetical protein